MSTIIVQLLLIYIDVVIITDGRSNGALNVCEEVKCFSNHSIYDISTFSIGIGNTTAANELQCMQNLDDNDTHLI